MGGESWAVDFEANGIGAMIVGIDTYHDSMTRGRSVVGFVATMNATATKYYARWNSQSTSEELGCGLTVAMTACLQKFHEVNGRYPKRVIIYRDGVGDGQLDMVSQFELPKIKAAIATLGIDPQLIVIIVKKRIASRFFTHQGRTYSNLPPGTVIDSEVTRPEGYDFFIVSQSVNVGTVTCTHYSVIEDTSNFSPDMMQRFTYKLYHPYDNWPDTIRVPAPCQYAHKLAFKVGQSLQQGPSPLSCG